MPIKDCIVLVGSSGVVRAVRGLTPLHTLHDLFEEISSYRAH